MMKVVTAEEMRMIDNETIKHYGVSGATLMERAGTSVARKIKEIFEPKKVVVLSGAGNNGGDGIVSARHFHKWGWDVKVFMLAHGERDLSADCLRQYRIAKKDNVKIEFKTSINEKEIAGAIVVDAIFGTGLSKEVKAPFNKIIALLNRMNLPVVSVDIASGISSDTGQIMGEAVIADYTVTFGLPKRGHFLYPGAGNTGKLFVEDIGFPDELIKSEKIKIEYLEKKDVSLLVPERQKYSHKGDYGHVLIIAGSRGKTGAAFMCAKSCLRAGAGIVTIGVPESLMNIFQSRATEEMTLILPDRGDGTLSSAASGKILEFLSAKADVLAIGPGISDTNDIKKIVSEIVLGSTKPMVLDADAVNSLSGKTKIFENAKAPIILTPHPGEMARLLGKTKYKISDIEKNRIEIARAFSKETGTYLVLKGVPTIISEPEGRAYINSTGNSGMATGGSGDVLTGIIASFLGQGLNPLCASILGVFMHGYAGDIAASGKGEHSLIASDIIDSISETFLSMR
jgi:hydroxyethylthiazole kinase-like uncharacterized protein yjeF